MRVAFSGSRNFHDPRPVRKALMRLRDVDLFVDVGDANGLDRIVRNLCRQLGIPFKVHKAHWSLLGKRAGHERNGRVLGIDRPEPSDMLLAFFDATGPTPGTTDCITQARGMGIETHVYHAHLRAWR